MIHTVSMVLITILFIAYLIGINIYSFILFKSQRDEFEATGEIKRSGEGRLLLAGALGGAILIYLCMFLFRYRLKSLLLMIAFPLLCVLNVYTVVALFRSGFTMFVI